MTATRSQPPPVRHRDEQAREPGAAARWWAGWRISLRMARRDIGRHRWRSALIALMVCLPVLIMVGGLTVVSTNEVSMTEAVPARMGSAQALLTGRADRRLHNRALSEQVRLDCGDEQVAHIQPWGWEQTTTPMCGPGTPAPTPARPVPGLPATPDLAQTEQALDALTGGRVVPVSWTTREALIDDQAVPVTSLAMDATDPATAGMATLVSGRWPGAAGEYVVTDVGERLGLPSSGTLQLIASEAEPGTPASADPRLLTETGTIVGVAQAAPHDTQEVGLITEAPTTLTSTQFLLERAEPVSAAQVQRLNEHGVMLVSRAVIADPGSLPAPPGERGDLDEGTQLLVATTLLCLVLLLESCLLAGPAFAVIAQRQRRSLALAAANGATRAQLRRTLLAQALLLGALAAVVGLLLGLLGAAVAVPLAMRQGWLVQPGPFEIPRLEVLVILGCAILAAVVSALIPARGLTRLDVVGALRGDVVSPPAERRLPVAGLALFAAGAALLWFTVTRPPGDGQVPLWTIGVLAAGLMVVVGALLLVPMILALLARAAGGMPVSVRMATRDALRHRGRAIPTVAAVMAAGIVLASLGIGGTTADAYSREQYRPSAPAGQAYFPTDAARLPRQDVPAAIAAAVPGATVRENFRFTFEAPQGTAAGASPTAASTADPAPEQPAEASLAVLPAGCTPQAVMERSMPWMSAPTPERAECQAPWASGSMTSMSLVVARPDMAAALYGLDPQAQQTLADGGAVVAGADLAPQGQLTFALGRSRFDPTDGAITWRSTTQTVRVPAAVAPLTFSAEEQPQVLIAPALAQRLGGSVVPAYTFVQSPTGEFTEAQRMAISTALRFYRGDMVSVERGYTSSIRWVLLVTFIAVALLTVVATVTATALSMGEARRDLATLAAVGAPDRLRRRLAGVQAGLLALVGTVLGLAVGAVPGVVFALLVTGVNLDGASVPGFVSVPWWPILAALVLTPLLAAAVAALFVRTRPDMTRRLS